MTTPSGPIIGAAHLDDGLNTRFRWNAESGLSSPAPRATGSIQATFGGPVLVQPAAGVYGSRPVSLPGYLLQVNGLSQGYDRLARLYELAGTAGTVSVLQMGALGLRLIVEPPSPEELRAHSAQLDYTLKGTAARAVWTALFGDYLGATYGVLANAETLAGSAYLLGTGSRVYGTNPGTAATPLVLTISGPTSRFFIRCTAPGYTRRIAVTPVTGGVTRVTEADGLLVPPGDFALRYEDSAGALVSAGTIVSTIYGTRWRYEGLPVELEDAGPVILYNSRAQGGHYATGNFGTASGLISRGADYPRFGNAGTFDSADAGLLIEPDRTNICLQSQALATAPWAAAGTITRTDFYSTGPSGGTNATRLVFTAGVAGSCSQSITLTAAPYVISFYARSTGVTAQTFTVSMPAILASTVVTTGQNWARYSYLVTGTPIAYTLTFADNAMAAADVLVWGVQVELATGQTAANATSYIRTTSTTQRRYADTVGVRKLENLLAWSNRFDKTTAVTGTPGLWFVSGATVTTATMQAGPSGIFDAATVAFTVAGQYVWQTFLNVENLAGKTVVFSIWVKNSSSTPDSDLTVRLSEAGTGAGSSDHSVTNLDDTWRRISVSRAVNAGVTELRAAIIAPSGTATVYVAHAQAFVIDGDYPLAGSLASTSITAPYVETFGVPYYGDKTWLWPDWLSQNGYIEADICFGETANPNSVARYYIGGHNSFYFNGLWGPTIFRQSSVSSASNTIAYARQNNLGTATSIYTPASSLYNSTYRKFRLEWVNYTLSGVRTIRLYLYVDGVEVSNTTTAGATAWLNPSFLNIVGTTNGGEVGFQTMKNLVIGSPTLPAGAIPEPY